MKQSRIYPLAAATAAILAGALVACESATDVNLLSDATITSDVAVSAGDEISVAVNEMINNESTASLSSIEAPPTANLSDNSLSINRSRKCLDANNAVVTNCTPLSSVRKIVTDVQMDGTRSGSSADGSKTWTGAVHRTAHDTVTRVFNGSNVETQRVHAGVNAGNDTTTFAEGEFSRKVVEAGVDSVQSVTFNVPRSQNPWPVSGKIVRNVTVTVTLTRENSTQTRTVTRRIEVDFPADAQGNVVLKINDRTCNLNLVTHTVTACT